MNTDTDRINFLESLMERQISMSKKQPPYYKRCDIHISGPDQCSLYARTEIGSCIEFQGHGGTVREMIDYAIIAANS